MSEEQHLCYCGHPKERHREEVYAVKFNFQFGHTITRENKNTSCYHCACTQYAEKGDEG